MRVGLFSETDCYLLIGIYIRSPFNFESFSQNLLRACQVAYQVDKLCFIKMKAGKFGFFSVFIVPCTSYRYKGPHGASNHNSKAHMGPSNSMELFYFQS